MDGDKKKKYTGKKKCLIKLGQIEAFCLNLYVLYSVSESVTRRR